jgi:Pyridoxamine 5'-phosphate oxidase
VAGDEQVRAQATGSRPAAGLTAAESWRLLAGVSLGRIVFTRRAMPAIRPVNHLVDDKTIIIPVAPGGGYRRPRRRGRHGGLLRG